MQRAYCLVHLSRHGNAVQKNVHRHFCTYRNWQHLLTPVLPLLSRFNGKFDGKDNVSHITYSPNNVSATASVSTLASWPILTLACRLTPSHHHVSVVAQTHFEWEFCLQARSNVLFFSKRIPGCSSRPFLSKGCPLVRSYSGWLKVIQTGVFQDGSVRIQQRCLERLICSYCGPENLSGFLLLWFWRAVCSSRFLLLPPPLTSLHLLTSSALPL